MLSVGSLLISFCVWMSAVMRMSVMNLAKISETFDQIVRCGMTRWVGGAKKAGLYRFEEAGTDQGAFIDQSHSPSPHLILIRGQRDDLQLIR